MNNFWTRAITGVVFVSALIFFAVTNKFLLAFLFLFFTIVGTHEYFNIVNNKKTKKYDDGWFAHIVEKGDFGPRFGGKHRTQNTGVFSRGMKATKNRSEKRQFILLKREFAKYAKTL